MPLPPDTGLPVEASIDALTSALAEHRAAVLVAPPGSGKTTVVPLRLLAVPWLDGQRIVVLEPRRLATRAAARRMAHLLAERVGDTVGYVTRDDRKVGPSTRIEVVTEGVLTRRLQRDPELPDTGVVVFDEFHERNLQTDLGLALALDSRRHLRPDLRLLAMSATIDARRVASLLGTEGGPAPVIESEAEAYPVEIRWAPLPKRARLAEQVAVVVRQALAAEKGDILVFLPGMGEIRRVAGQLEGVAENVDIRLLHGALPPAEQDAALVPSPFERRRVVLSTDIAETSLTVEGIRVVVDGGTARAPRFDARTGMTRLRTIPISRASADQRAGRAGRVEPGVAYRLWSKLEHGTRRLHRDPEISQIDLAGLALELAAWGTSDPSELRFPDQPPSRAFADGRLLLHRLGALDEDGRLTETGRRMTGLPLHPRLARMVAEAGDDAWLACVLAALIDDRDVLRGRPDELPVDLALRIVLIADPDARHPPADRRTVGRARASAEDLARRARTKPGRIDPERAGRVLALAFPDRLAIRRGTPGRFQLRTGTTAWMSNADSLAAERFLIAADLDGKRKDARIRLAAAIDPADVAELFADEVESKVELAWNGDRLVERRERRLGGLALDLVEVRPPASEATARALLDRVARSRLEALPWTDRATDLLHRVRFLHTTQGDPWPDWSEAELLVHAEEWLGPWIREATGLDDLARLDLAKILHSRLGHPLASEMDRVAPKHVEVPSGRRIRLDYSGGDPVLAVRVQEMFGSVDTPTVAGAAVVLHLLSPAGRPLQITRDLAGFWAGSWHEVRREMAGRYPKHSWPANPAAAAPRRS